MVRVNIKFDVTDKFLITKDRDVQATCEVLVMKHCNNQFRVFPDSIRSMNITRDHMSRKMKVEAEVLYADVKTLKLHDWEPGEAEVRIDMAIAGTADIWKWRSGDEILERRGPSAADEIIEAALDADDYPRTRTLTPAQCNICPDLGDTKFYCGDCPLFVDHLAEIAEPRAGTFDGYTAVAEEETSLTEKDFKDMLEKLKEYKKPSPYTTVTSPRAWKAYGGYTKEAGLWDTATPPSTLADDTAVS